ncbi:MAG TPA: cytochrome P450 [Gemmatimonadaceae bacterium]|jgi:cytochrome P450|nr:cytochrome P450 [Gemmatimonadaceae bacterium]
MSSEAVSGPRGSTSAGAGAAGPPALPIVGHAPAFLRDKLGFLSRCSAVYGDVVRLRIGGPTCLVTHPDDVKHVLVSSADAYEKTPRLTGVRGRRFFGGGLVTATGPAHLRQRRMLQPVFHRAVIDRFASVIAECTEAMLCGWRDGAVLDVHEEMLGVTQRITARALLGEEPEEVLQRFAGAASVRRRHQEHLLGSIVPLADRLPSRAQRRYARAHRALDEIVDAGIARRRAEPAPSGDLLSMLVHARYEDGTGMSDEGIRDEVRTLSVAGYETIAEALTWTWYLLAGAPEPETTMRAEVDAAVDREGVVGLAELAKLPWCRMVLAESMRLYPPTWMFVRVAQRDDVLPSGVFVAAGTKIYLSQWVMHRNPRYFPEPGRFDPRRFTAEAIAARPRFTYLPFGAGRRLCIGEEFAWMQGVSILASVARRFRLTLASARPVVPEPNVTLRPRGGLPMRLAAR